MSSRLQPSCLSIIIPAFNEEDSIGNTISECLKAKEHIKTEADLKNVEIIVVNDGSTDRTATIAESYNDITLINLEENQGYGAAIKHGFSKASGDLLGFLDGDGTCDPLFFADMCKKLLTTPADLVTGSRMHKTSKMPVVRRIGNLFYAYLMSAMTNCKVEDTASGMRVMRKTSLHDLSPLPDGLHFTPAMTCRALLKDHIIFEEIEMPYHERQGISKLSVLRDGIRFLLAITDISLTYRPLKFFGLAGILLIIIALFYSINPLYSRLVHHTFSEGSIYRLLAINTFFLAGITLICVGIVAERIISSLNGYDTRFYTKFEHLLLKAFSLKKMILMGPVFLLSGLLLNTGSIFDYLTTLQISYHWGYISTGALLILMGLQLLALAIVERLLDTVVKETNGRR